MLIRGTIATNNSSRATPYRTGAWYGVDCGPNPITTQPLAADTAYCYPIILERPSSIRRLRAIIGTAVLTSTLRMALYAGAPNVFGPTSLLVGSMTEYDMGQAANTEIELDLATDIMRPVGLYWAVTRGANAPQPQTINSAINANAAIMRISGHDNARAVFQSGGGTQGSQPIRLTFPLTYASVWPDTAPASTYGNNVPGSPVVAWSPTL